MGKKYKLSKKVLKKRPKKRGPYKEKEPDPRKPRTQEETEEVFPGSKPLSQLSKGIVEFYDEEEGQDDTEVAGIPVKWGKLMSDSPEVQCQFNKKLNEVRENYVEIDKPTAGYMDNTEHETLFTAAQTEFAKRWATVNDSNPAFMNELVFVLQPFIKLEGVIGEGKKRKVLTQSIASMDAEAIQNLCRKRFGLMTLQSLLQLIDQINRAGSGKLMEPQKQS